MLHPLSAGLAERAGHDQEVDLVGVFLFAGALFQEQQMDMRRFQRAELGELRRQQHADVVGGLDDDPQPFGRRIEGARRFQQQFQVRQYRRQRRQDFSSPLGKPRMAASRDNEVIAEYFAQLPQGLADRRLADAQLFGARRDAAGAQQGVKHRQQVQVHPSQALGQKPLGGLAATRRGHAD